MSAHPIRRFRHGPWIVALPAALVCGYLLNGAFRLARFREAGVQLPAPGPPVEADAPPTRSAVGRDIFCSRCNAPGPTPPRPAAVEVGDLRLLATVLGQGSDRGRFAVIVIGEGVGLLAAGAAIDARRRLLQVAPRHVTIATPAGPARLDLLAGDDPMPVAAPATRSSERRGVTSLGGHRYRIEAGLRDALLADPARALRCGRVLPRADGLRLRGIRRRCLWWALGLRDGDLLRAINGRRLSPEMALQMMVRLRHASRLTLAVERRGQPLTLEYEIGG